MIKFINWLSSDGDVTKEEVANAILYKPIDKIIKQIKDLDTIFIKTDLIDTQTYLNFKDELNKLSIDPDRK